MVTSQLPPTLPKRERGRGSVALASGTKRQVRTGAVVADGGVIVQIVVIRLTLPVLGLAAMPVLSGLQLRKMTAGATSGAGAGAVGMRWQGRSHVAGSTTMTNRT
jgi:hypothetical protein